MIQVLFLQGGGEGVHDGWDNQLVTHLQGELGAEYELRYPRMPHEEDPKADSWMPVVRQELARLGDGALMVGHSMGATILIHTLAQQPPAKRLGGMFLLAAPYIGEGGWPSDDLKTYPAIGARLPADVPVFLYHGTADSVVPFEHLTLYSKTLPRAAIRPLPDRDHQLGNDLSLVAEDIKLLVARYREPSGVRQT